MPVQQLYSNNNAPLAPGDNWFPSQAGQAVGAGILAFTVDTTHRSDNTLLIKAMFQLQDAQGVWNNYGGGWSFLGGTYTLKDGSGTSGSHSDQFAWPGGQSRIYVQSVDATTEQPKAGTLDSVTITLTT